MHQPMSSLEVAAYAKRVTALFLLGWGTGGMIFGSLGDKYGRARMLSITVLIYSFCTGLSFFSKTPGDFALFRFLTGLGVGGVFGLSVALIAETVSPEARPHTLGLLQVLSTVGTVAAGFAKKGVDGIESSHLIAPDTGWRWMFLIGALPALLLVFTLIWLREPDSWLKLKAAGALPKGGPLAPYRGLLAEKRWRKNLFVGAVLASTGVVGLWAIAEYAIDLQRTVFRAYFEVLVPADQIKGHIDSAMSTSYVLMMLGAAVGMWIFTKVATKVGRIPAFAGGFTINMLVTIFVYWKLSTPADAYWMMPLLGAAQFSVFAGFAIYLPELFPNRLRSTGTSFCYNIGRFAAAGGSLFSAMLSERLFKGFASPLPLRYSAITMCSIFLAGLGILFIATETKGKPLPEDGPEPLG